MWRCTHCGETVDEDDFEVCWRCSTPRGADGPAATPPDDDGRAPRVPVWAAVVTTAASVRAHPVILVAALPLLAWDAAATAIGSPTAGFFGAATRSMWPLEIGLLPATFVVGPFAMGLTMALVQHAMRGRPSVTGAAATVLTRFPALLALVATGAGWILLVRYRPAAGLALLLPAFYVGVRLAFATAAVVLEGRGPLAAAHRSWVFTRDNWWRTFAVTLLPAMAASAPDMLPWRPVAVLLTECLAPLTAALLAVAFLMRAGELRPAPAGAGLAGRRQVAPAT
jgi:hypothetical protein